jgi:hypothetical protein
MVVIFVSNPLAGMTTYERYTIRFRPYRRDPAGSSRRTSLFMVCREAELVQTDTYCAPFIKTRSDAESKVHGMGDGPRTMLFDATIWKRVVKA